jgi:hypothetical protein
MQHLRKGDKYACQVCESVYTHPASLKKHMLSHTKEQLDKNFVDLRSLVGQAPRRILVDTERIVQAEERKHASELDAGIWGVLDKLA